jgi:hypothetical protein
MICLEAVPAKDKCRPSTANATRTSLGVIAVAGASLLAPVSTAQAAVSCANFETIPASALVAAVKWNSANYGLVPPSLGCERSAVGKCDFQNRLVTDTRLGARRRLIVVNADHLLGSGAHDVLTVYACRDNQVAVVLSGAFEYGIKIEYADAQAIVFTAGLWGDTDAHCCPSREQRFRYSWSAASMSYQLKNRETFPAQR